jgi:[protein-PII] uridylyltransferase
VTQALTKLNLIIHGAKISTYGERVVDAFYVQDALGDKVENPARLRRIRQRLLQALEDQKCRPAPAALAGEVRATRAQAGRLRAAAKPQGKTRKRADAGD